MSRKNRKLDNTPVPQRQEGVPVLDIQDLNVSFPSEDGVVRAVRGVNLKVYPGEVLGIVGESGSGKSVTSLAVMGLLDESASVEGSVKLHGTEILGKSDAWMSKIRGKKVAMVFQDPLSALTPVYTIGDQIVEALTIHQKMSKTAARERAVELLELVGIPNPEVRFKAFPHEFSGGMRQRVMIAIAIANDPDLIIADEPTTALDVTIQAQILDLLKKAQRETNAAVLMITHDLGVVAGMADRVAVMYAGRCVEYGSVDDIFYHSTMPYTVGLLGSLPRPDQDSSEPLASVEGNPPSMLQEPTGCPFAPRCPISTDACLNGEPELRVSPNNNPNDGVDHTVACVRAEDIVENNWDHANIYPMPEAFSSPIADEDRMKRDEVMRVTGLKKYFPLMKGAVFKRQVGTVHAVDEISLDIREGETLALVGESGSGKTTTLLEVLNLQKPQGGTIVVFGKDAASMSGRERRKVREDLQVVFQDPMASLDPRMPIFDIIAEPLKYNNYPKDQVDARVEELMTLVGLEPAHLNRYPRHFSGGQRQRIGIARALALSPRLLVLDEPVSALDVSIQAGVINLLEELRAKLGLSYLFVAHDLSVVRHIADRVAVMYLGKIVEIGAVKEVFDRPRHPYTQALLSAIPIPDPRKERSRERILLEGDLPSPANPPSGCRFRTRCPKFLTLSETDQQRCVNEHPELEGDGDVDSMNACHYPEEAHMF
ncbi:ABC transporter ATP-binding protein [Gleimia europaea]|uniref:Oligopeptide/dipeptide ABC transporter, ATP-binding protein domain n=1 Tax=Gleimia europaea ACS-120-V-Col10b TaxID=883069 RepID=A0A9W5RDD3_9ACTO|nr:ABC transporter ATP-binding protein [Gleimia europaea]EPD29563.1 oligopeptide/dipeptide ABC transporter, ATP-binding protein domain [Gleimia europaea ACS-120-V-Col10b]